MLLLPHRAAKPCDVPSPAHGRACCLLLSCSQRSQHSALDAFEVRSRHLSQPWETQPFLLFCMPLVCLPADQCPAPPSASWHQLRAERGRLPRACWGHLALRRAPGEVGWGCCRPFEGILIFQGYFGYPCGAACLEVLMHPRGWCAAHPSTTIRAMGLGRRGDSEHV